MRKSETLRIAVASGKGGTGKTTLAVGLALASNDAVLADCDVEAPNAHLFLNPTIRRRENIGVPIPVIDQQRCDVCRQCVDVCEFNALIALKHEVLVFEQLCHGCGACTYSCPRKAITEESRPIGVVESGDAGNIRFVQGRLNIGEPMPTPLVSAVLKRIEKDPLVIMDAAPGTSCPVVEVIRHADVCLLVTEPTPLGLHDLQLAVELCRTVQVPVGVVLNRSDIGDDAVANYCELETIPLLLRIPFERRIAEAYSSGVPITQAVPTMGAQLRRLGAELTAVADGAFGLREVS